MDEGRRSDDTAAMVALGRWPCQSAGILATASAENQMKIYRVEQMRDGAVIATDCVEAIAPFEAAAKVTGRKITLRNGAAEWIRVTDTTERSRPSRLPTVFEYKAIGSRKQS